MKQLYFIITSLCFSLCWAQLQPIDFNERIKESNVVVEGVVLEQNALWNSKKTKIYTVNRIQVYKIFKGTKSLTHIDICTPGGTIGFEKHEVNPSLKLKTGDTGLFILKLTQTSLEGKNNANLFRPYGTKMGFLKYDLTKGIAKGPFESFNNIDKSLYGAIKSVTTDSFVEVLPLNTKKKDAAFLGRRSLDITSISPLTTTAGTQTSITINGSGFGNITGEVRFSEADEVGAEFISGAASEILSWNDTQIVVQVNEGAGTGPVQVIRSTGEQITSSQSLTVNYALMNVEYQSDFYRTQHIDKNGNGGYIWQMHTAFDNNTAAKEAFMRSFNTWRCETGVNWQIGNTSSIDVAEKDNVNLILFDDNDPLNEGVLGVCINYFAGCAQGANILWYADELDIIFRAASNFPANRGWNFTTSAPTNNEMDFETVATHELGHGHALGHVIDPQDIMHPSVGYGILKRVPNANNIAGANNVQTRSTTNTVCNQNSMIDFDCSLSLDPANNFRIKAALNPNSKTLDINSKIFIEELTIHNVLGQPVVSQKTNAYIMKVDLSQLKKGVYFLIAKSENKSTSLKFLISH
jgi:hypothetical protein